MANEVCFACYYAQEVKLLHDIMQETPGMETGLEDESACRTSTGAMGTLTLNTK